MGGHGIPALNQAKDPEVKLWNLTDKYDNILNRIGMECKKDKYIFTYTKDYNAVQGCLQWLSQRFLELRGSKYSRAWISGTQRPIPTVPHSQVHLTRACSKLFRHTKENCPT